MIDGLSNGLCYTFQVVAVNAVGEGAPSQWSTVVVPGSIPDTPTVTAIAGDRMAVVSWTVPDNNGRRLIEYRIRMYRAITNFPEGIDASDPVEENWVVRKPYEERNSSANASDLPGMTNSYVWSHFTNHPIDN